MQSSLDEIRYGTGHMEEIPGSPLLSWDSTNSSDFSESPWVFPRIGDKYQVNVSPFMPQVDCDKLEMTESMNCKGTKDEHIEKWFAEGLALPVTHISCFSPIVGINKFDMTDMNGSILDNELVTIQRDCGLPQQDLVHSTDDGCAHEPNDSYRLTEAKVSSSITDLKTEILGADDSCSISTLKAENMPDAFCSHGGRKRKRGRLGWKKFKKIKGNLLDSNFQIQHPRMYNSGRDANSGSYFMVPGSPSAPWSKSEEDLFLLGLYTFGKNFSPVKRFVETKEMRDILSYYYGVFFRSESYCRWADSRKPRSRKCVQGLHIFSGWRQQEFLTRLLPYIPELSKHEVPEITKAFNEGRTSLEEFVTKLKLLAGPDVLFQAVGIGKGKQDLTSALIEPAKTHRALSSRREIPVGRAYSSLSIEDIVQILTGDFRISKARADDLFWEAVWPRLLARGWQSERPADQLSFGLRQSLVFLIPGVQKFSRRKLTKGIHYFDSVNEVLSRMASDPSLLELDTDGMRRVEGRPESLWASENAVVENGYEGKSRHYLQPRTCTKTESFIFTVVDTSLTSQGEQPHRMRERVTLPLDDYTEKFQTISWETEYEDNQASLLTEEQRCKCSAVGDLLNNNSEGTTHCVINNEISANYNGIVGTLMSPVSNQNNALSLPFKQKSLNTCHDCKDDTVDASSTECCSLKVQVSMLNVYSMDATSESPSHANTSENGISILSSTQGSPERSLNSTIFSRDLPSANNIRNCSQNFRECIVIPEMELGLKLLQDQPDNTAMNCIFVMGSELMDGSKTEGNSYYETGSQCPDEESDKKSQVPQALNSGPHESRSAEPQENIASTLPENTQRQSTRVRPPTARALEAFASGFLSPKRRKTIGENTLNSDGHRTKSVSKLVKDELIS